jgi:hypothetical protein
MAPAADCTSTTDLASTPSPNDVLPARFRQMANVNAPKPLHIERSREFVPLALEAVVSKRELYTDYLVTRHQVIVQRRLPASPAFGTIPQIVAKRWGGHTSLGGVSASVEDAKLRPFSSGEELVLFLRADKDGKYRIVEEVAGAVHVASGQVGTWHVQDSGRYIGMSVSRLQTELERLGR